MCWEENFINSRMIDQDLSLATETWVGGQAGNRFRQEYHALWALYGAQPEPIRFFLVFQAQILAEALVQRPNQFSFNLPTWIICKAGEAAATPLPSRAREQHVGGFVQRFVAGDLREQLLKRISRLEHDLNPAVSTGAKLLRFATAVHIVHGILPPVVLVTSAADGVDLDPVLLIEGELAPGYVIVAGNLTPIQPFIRIFRDVIALAPYMVVDSQYLQKRYRLLGRWIKQNRDLAQYETMEIIRALHQRGRSLSLHRGLRISLPYFDDQELELKFYEFSVVPACRIGFEPAFVAGAARIERQKIAGDNGLSLTTRNHLLAQLRLLEHSFHPSSSSLPVKI